MKILFATDSLFPSVGGVQVLTYRWARILAKYGNDVSIVAPSPDRNEGMISDNGIKIFTIPSFSVPFHKYLRYSPYTLSKKRMEGIFNENLPDVVHLQTSMMVARAASDVARKQGVAVVSSHYFMTENNNLYGGLISKGAAKLVNLYSWSASNKILNEADLITTLTKSAVKYLDGRIKTNKIFNIVNSGIDFSVFNNSKSKIKIRKKYGIEDKEKVILYVGRMDKEKGVCVIINALPVLSKNDNVKLVLVGYGNEMDHLKKLVKDMKLDKYVIFPGFVPDKNLREYYKLADIFVMPSTAELQSIATLEALASGLPVVAARAGALPELVKNGINGYLFSPGNSKKMAEYILKTLSNPRIAKNMGLKSFEMAKNYDINSIAIQLENLYRKAININNQKQTVSVKSQPYLLRRFVFKTALTFGAFLLLFRLLTMSPTVARAESRIIKSKILNSNIAVRVENLSLKLKTAFPSHRLEK